MARPSKRNEIIQAATKLIGERGLGSVSVRDIAAAAGLRASTVYRIFPDKDEIFQEVLKKVLSESDRWRRHFLTADASPAEKVKSTVYYSLRDGERLQFHRKIMQRALVDEDLATLKNIQALSNQSEIVVEALAALSPGKDPWFLFYTIVGLATGYVSYRPIFRLLNAPPAIEMDDLALADEILNMVIPAINWKEVSVLPAPGLKKDSQGQEPSSPV